MASGARLVVLDSVMVDVLVKVDQLPTRGADALASAALVTTGGGFTVAAAAHRHGLSVAYAGRLGTGPLADLARGALTGEDVATPVTPDADHDIGFCLVMVDAGAERTFITVKGSELRLTSEDLDAVAVGAGDYLYLSGYNLVYPEIAGTVSAWLASLDPGVIVAFDPGARVADVPPDELAATLRRTNWLLCNSDEAGVLSGEVEPEAQANALLARTGGDGVVIHAGHLGCWVVTPTQRCVRVAGFATGVVDTNGAGDIHNGVLLAELADGYDVLEAARRANAAASLAVATLGPVSHSSRDEVIARAQSLSGS